MPFTTRRDDASFMARRLADLHRAWKVGDRVQGMRGLPSTTIVEIRSDVALLADGTNCHVSRLRGEELAK